MQIMTSYFRQQAELQRAGVLCVSIARAAPKGFQGQVYSNLAPAWGLLNGYRSGTIDEVTYVRVYRQWLARLGPKRVLSGLSRFGDKMALCCWEGPGKFCHRHLVSEWLNGSGLLEIQVVEFGHG